MSRAAQVAALGAALAIVLAGAVGRERGARAAAVSALPSAESFGPRGLAAARAFLAETGRGARRLSSRSERPPRGAALVLAAPRAPLGPDEADALLAHAAEGGTVLWLAGGAPQPALSERLALRVSPRGARRTAVALAPHPLLDGLSLPASGSVASAHVGALPVAGGDGLASAVAIPVGAGEVLVLSGPDALENGRVGEGDGIALLARLAARGPVAFDERWLLPEGTPASAADRAVALLALQALLAGGVLVVARGRRLGAIRPPQAGRGRTARDYLVSLAALYRRAGAEPELARVAWSAARRALERRAGIPARLPAADAAARLARRSPAAAEALVRGEAAAAAGRGALLAATRAAADLERALRGRPGAA